MPLGLGPHIVPCLYSHMASNASVVQPAFVKGNKPTNDVLQITRDLTHHHTTLPSSCSRPMAWSSSLVTWRFTLTSRVTNQVTLPPCCDKQACAQLCPACPGLSMAALHLSLFSTASPQGPWSVLVLPGTRSIAGGSTGSGYPPLTHGESVLHSPALASLDLGP